MIRRLFPLLLLPMLASCAGPREEPISAPPAGVDSAVPAGADSASRIRADFLKLIDRPRVPADARLEESAHADGLLQYRLTFAAQAGQRIPGILIKPDNMAGRLPVVIALHGTGGNKESQLGFLRQLARKGFLAVAIDAPYHGERATRRTGHPNSYDDAILRAYMDKGGGEHPFFMDTVWDMMRLVDYLETRDDVDRGRIGMFGISKGGIETYLTAAVDTRIAAAVPCIGVESFRWAVENNRWQPRIETVQAAFDAAARAENIAAPDSAFVDKFYDRVSPGLAGEFDGPAMVPLIAPRYLFVINGELDPRTPPPSLQLCTDAALAAYQARHAADHFKLLIQPNTPHRVNPASQQEALEWLAACLHASAPPSR